MMKLPEDISLMPRTRKHFRRPDVPQIQERVVVQRVMVRMSQRNPAMARKNKRKSKRKTISRKKSAVRRKTKRTTKRPTKRRAPRRSEADMAPREIRASRLRRSSQREGRIEREFQRAVNMTTESLSKWLKSRESRSIGGRSNELSDHWSGRRVLEIKKKKPGERTPADYSHMRKVIAYVSRHSAKRPTGDVRSTPWRYGLMNWGHDPLK
jgi:hypothetical protein